MIANNPHFRPSTEMCCRIVFTHAVIDYQKDQISFHNSYLTIWWVNLEVFRTLGTRYGLISGTKAVFSNLQIGQQTFMTNSLNANPSRIERVGDWLFHALDLSGMSSPSIHLAAISIELWMCLK